MAQRAAQDGVRGRRSSITPGRGSARGSRERLIISDVKQLTDHLRRRHGNADTRSGRCIVSGEIVSGLSHEADEGRGQPGAGGVHG
uniref:Uncharacterized protein n=1 Tax=Knipowitschia caucasica TaxID=637954 RepID=A0AAV2MQU2_KNICA